MDSEEAAGWIDLTEQQLGYEPLSDGEVMWIHHRWTEHMDVHTMYRELLEWWIERWR